MEGSGELLLGGTMDARVRVCGAPNWCWSEAVHAALSGVSCFTPSILKIGALRRQGRMLPLEASPLKGSEAGAGQ